jgi:hypothetical protein
MTIFRYESDTIAFKPLESVRRAAHRRKGASNGARLFQRLWMRILQYLETLQMNPQDVELLPRGIFADDARTPHCCDFAAEVYGNKRFLHMISPREHGIAPSWGNGGNDHRQPCITRGRQQKWYKDFWLLQWQRLWRLWPYRATKTVPRIQLHRTWHFNRRPYWAVKLSSYLCRGRVFVPVRRTSFAIGCV